MAKRYRLDSPLFFDLYGVKKQPELTANRNAPMKGLRPKNPKPRLREMQKRDFSTIG